MAESPKILATIGKLLFAVVPPSIAGASWWVPVKQNPWFSLIIFALYELLVISWSVGSEIAGELRKRWVPALTNAIDVALRRKLTLHERRYLTHIKETNFYMDLKGFTTRGPFTSTLDGAFVGLNLLPQPINTVSNALVDTDELYLGAILDDKEISIWDLLRVRDGRTVPLAVVGPPGSGKTTLLKHIALSLARRDNNDHASAAFRSKIPVQIVIRQHAAHISSTPNCTIPEIVGSTLIRAGIVEPSGWMAKQLNDGRAVILLDGLDEVATREGRKAIVDWVEGQIVRYPKNYFILTSRPYGYQPYPINAATFAKIAPFTERKIEQFIIQWYLDTELRSKGDDNQGVRDEARADADDLLRRLRQSAALYRLGTNPLLLTMIANVHKYRGALPGSRHELFREICQVFLGKRQEAKQLDLDMTTDQKESVLRRLAFEMMKGRQRDIAQNEAASLIRSQLNRVKPGTDPVEFLSEVEEGSGILYEREDGYYGFAHLTFQEYLTAAYIAENRQAAILAGKVSDEWWRETTLLFVAQYGGDDIVRACLHGDKPAATAIALAIDCASESRELSPDIRSSLERLLAREAIDDSRRGLLAHVLLIRKLRDSVRISEDTWLCPTPVTNEEFALFRDDYGSALPIDSLVSSPADAAIQVGDAALGAGRETVSVFVNWCRSMVGDVRLPTTDELSRAIQTNSELSASALAFWVASPTSISLYKGHLDVEPELDGWLSEQVLLDCTKVADWLENTRNPLALRLMREIPGNMAMLASTALGVDCMDAQRLKFTSQRGDGKDYSVWDIKTKRGDQLQFTLVHDSRQVLNYEASRNGSKDFDGRADEFNILSTFYAFGGMEVAPLSNGIDRLRLRDLAIALAGVDTQLLPSPGLCAVVQDLIAVTSKLPNTEGNDEYFVCARVGAAVLASAMMHRRVELAMMQFEIPLPDEEVQCFVILVEILTILAMIEWRTAGDLDPNEAILLVKSPTTTLKTAVPSQRTRRARRRRAASQYATEQTQ